MSKLTLVCVDCNRVDAGDGNWTETDDGIDYNLTNALCPDCCHSRFPEFYSDYEGPAKKKFGVSGVLSALKKLCGD